jgi:hypothetical protein
LPAPGGDSLDKAKFLHAESLKNPRRYDSEIYLLEDCNGRWWVGINVKEPYVRMYLKARAESMGLLGGKDADEVYKGQDIVWMLAR